MHNELAQYFRRISDTLRMYIYNKGDLDFLVGAMRFSCTLFQQIYSIVFSSRMHLNEFKIQLCKNILNMSMKNLSPVLWQFFSSCPRKVRILPPSNLSYVIPNSIQAMPKSGSQHTIYTIYQDVRTLGSRRTIKVLSVLV